MRRVGRFGPPSSSNLAAEWVWRSRARVDRRCLSRPRPEHVGWSPEPPEAGGVRSAVQGVGKSVEGGARTRSRLRSGTSTYIGAGAASIDSSVATATGFLYRAPALRILGGRPPCGPRERIRETRRRRRGSVRPARELRISQARTASFPQPARRRGALEGRTRGAHVASATTHEKAAAPRGLAAFLRKFERFENEGAVTSGSARKPCSTRPSCGCLRAS